MAEEELKERETRRKIHREVFKMMIIPLCSVVILICLKDMSLSYVFAEKVIEGHYQNITHYRNISQLSEKQFRNASHGLAEAIANVNAMWAGLHAIGLYAVVVEEVCVLWAFSTLETLADILVIVYWTGGFFPLVLPDMALLTLYFFLITVFSWVLTLTVF